MVGLRTVQYTFIFRIQNSFVQSIPVNYRYQYYRHELILEELGVKNMGLKISPHCRYQTYFRQIHSVVVQSYEFRARWKQLNLGTLVLRGGMLLLNTLPTFRRHCIRTFEVTIPWLLWHIYHKRPTKHVVTTATLMLHLTAEAIGHWILHMAQLEIVSISDTSAMQQTSKRYHIRTAVHNRP